MRLKLIKLGKGLLPICPECGKRSIVAFTPPKEGLVGSPKGYEVLGTVDYVDWDRAHLYCSNAESNCTFNTRIFDLHN